MKIINIIKEIRTKYRGEGGAQTGGVGEALQGEESVAKTPPDSEKVYEFVVSLRKRYGVE
ncbi:hypothetical protein HPP92_017133 [Vanilla planifolia]|uniref:Uncharacterized protein n=1 Tax=Vanilla planifolia TaxID=51239 RepID=A0A835QC17_VANPL|nr:hypothetical protein HPP92_017708 [Vanilla planifolia]KAG0467805.1 hypothetical protein HPP92_017133 [Vanilla planifolia]